MPGQQLSDILSQRLQQNNQVTTNDARVSASLPSNYYAGTQSFATQSPMDRLAATTQGSQVLQQQVSTIISGRQQDAAVQRAQAAAAAALKAQQQTNAAAGKQSFDVKWQKGLSAAQRAALQSASPGGAGGSLFGSGTSGSYQVTGNRANTSGAAGAIGGTRGSGTYKYVYNKNLDSQRNAALALATSYLGTPYVLGGESHSSMDCSGLVQLVYSKMGFRVPTHSSADQGQTGGRNNGNGIPGVKTSIRNLQPGDLVCWRDGSHIAIYAGNGMIIESANPTRGTLARKLWAPESAVIGLHVTFPGER